MQEKFDPPSGAYKKHPGYSPQNIASGLLLLLPAGLALGLIRDLSQGTLSSMGAAMFPKWIAIGILVVGIILLISGLVRPGARLEQWSLRGLAFVPLAILGFGATIKGGSYVLGYGAYALGPIDIPALGLIVSGPLAILVGGYGTPEARLRELVVLAFVLTPFCMVLFGDVLKLPIPVFPSSLTKLFPAYWSQSTILRVVAAAMLILAVFVHIGTRSHIPRDSG